MEIFINDKLSTIQNSLLSDLILELEIKDTKGIAIAVNEQVIPKSTWNSFNLNQNDKLIIITATAGG